MTEIQLISLLKQEFNVSESALKNTLALFNEGATIPFVARYRKEMTQGLDEVQLRDISDRVEYLNELTDRKKTVLSTIEEQGKLTEELQLKIENTLSKSELEDLYLPYKPKRRTRAIIAKEKGLSPLADKIKAMNSEEASEIIALVDLAKDFVNDEVLSVDEALSGASDILAEEVAEKAEHRSYMRAFILDHGVFKSTVKDEFPVNTTKFENYRDFSSSVKDIPAHAMLALRRGEAEGILSVNLEFEEGSLLYYLQRNEIFSNQPDLVQFYESMLADAFKRLLHLSLVAEVRLLCKQKADVESIETFETNLRELLLSAPAGMKPTIGLDPGFRTGCKVAALDETGKLVDHLTIYPHNGDARSFDAAEDLIKLINKHNIELIAVGNGTAGRESLAFLNTFVLTDKRLKNKPIAVMVNESGASIYSASDVAREEFPDLDLTLRGAASIGRRLQDPLAELVKIDPKSIGVGQYQHDVDQKLLKKKLEETVESCVNFVGIDLNTASKELLSFVSGITPTTAKNIIEWRNTNGAFKERKQLLDVAKFGPKSYEQAAGFLRIRNGNNPLDNTAVHPERYAFIKKIASENKYVLTQTADIAKEIEAHISNYVNNEVGLPTLKDMIDELRKPGRDPRAAFTYATFKEGVDKVTDLKIDMTLEGVVTNVANFGAFVDIGVHQDGLIHVSQLADRFVKDPNEIVKVGQVVKVRVVEIDEARGRIALSMRSNATLGTGGGNNSNSNSNRNTLSRSSRNDSGNRRYNSNTTRATDQKSSPENSLEALKAKFNSKL